MEINAVSGVPSRSSARHRRTMLLTTLTAAAALVVGSATPSVAAVTGPLGVHPDGIRPQVAAMPVSGPLGIGFTFAPAKWGTLSAVRFSQNAPNSGVVSASVWSSTGVLLAQAPVNPVAAVGWRTVPLELDLDADVTTPSACSTTTAGSPP